MKRFMMFTIITLLVLTLAFSSCAQRGQGWERQGSGPGQGKPSEKQIIDPTTIPDFQIIDIHLSTEQMARINILRETCLKNLRPMQEEIFVKRRNLKLIWQGENRDEKKMEDLHRGIKYLKDEMQEKIAEYVLEVRMVLTPDQDSLLRAFWPDLGIDKERRGAGPEGGYIPSGEPGNMDAGRRGPRGRW